MSLSDRADIFTSNCIISEILVNIPYFTNPKISGIRYLVLRPLHGTVILHPAVEIQYHHRLIELRFNVPLDTIQVISETLFPANLLASTEITKNKAKRKTIINHKCAKLNLSLIHI